METGKGILKDKWATARNALLITATGIALSSCSFIEKNFSNPNQKQPAPIIMSQQEQTLSKPRSILPQDNPKPIVIPSSKPQESIEIPKPKQNLLYDIQVSKGDNIWKIAKEELKNQGNKNSSNQDIQKKVIEIGIINGLRVIKNGNIIDYRIYPGQKLKILNQKAENYTTETTVLNPQIWPKKLKLNVAASISAPPTLPITQAPEPTPPTNEKAPIKPQKDLTELIIDPPRKPVNPIEQNTEQIITSKFKPTLPTSENQNIITSLPIDSKPPKPYVIPNFPKGPIESPFKKEEIVVANITPPKAPSEPIENKEPIKEKTPLTLEAQLLKTALKTASPKRFVDGYYQSKLAALKLLHHDQIHGETMQKAANLNDKVSLEILMAYAGIESGFKKRETDFDRGPLQLSIGAIKEAIDYELDKKKPNKEFITRLATLLNKYKYRGDTFEKQIKNALTLNSWRDSKFFRDIANSDIAWYIQSNRHQKLEETIETHLTDQYENLDFITKEEVTILASLLNNGGYGIKYKNLKIPLKYIKEEREKGNNPNIIEAISATKKQLSLGDNIYAEKITVLLNLVKSHKKYIQDGQDETLTKEQKNSLKYHENNIRKRNQHLTNYGNPQKFITPPKQKVSANDNNTNHYESLSQRYGGSKELALAAYMIGEDKIDKLATNEYRRAANSNDKFSIDRIISQISTPYQKVIKRLSPLEESKLVELTANEGFKKLFNVA